MVASLQDLALPPRVRRPPLVKRDPAPNPGDGGNGMSLSITNNMDVLRTKLLRELIQRRVNSRRQGWVSRNQEILNSVG